MKKLGLVLIALAISFNSYAQSVAVDVTSNSLEVERVSGTATFIGDVKALYKNVTLTSDKLRIVYDEKAKTSNKIEKIVATGDVVLIQGLDRVTGQKAEYFVADNKVVFTKDVVLNRNGNILKGEHLVMNTVTKKATMKSSGRNRVKAVYFNKKDENK